MRPAKQVLRREGEYWTIEFDGRLVRLRDSRGLRYLATLLRNPGRKLAATDVIDTADHGNAKIAKKIPESTADDPPKRDRRAERARLKVTKGIKSVLERITAVHPGLGAHLEAAVRRGYVCAYTPDTRYPTSWDE